MCSWLKGLSERVRQRIRLVHLRTGDLVVSPFIGKSTLLEHLATISPDFGIYQEALEEWKDYHGRNLLGESNLVSSGRGRGGGNADALFYVRSGQSLVN